MSSDSEDTKKPFYKKAGFWISIVILAFIAIVVIKVANSTSTIDKAIDQLNTVVTSTNTTEPDKIYSLGEEATLGSGSIIVTQVEKSSGDWLNKPKTGKEFVVVHVTIKNNGSLNLSYNPWYFKVQNSQGQQESITFSTIDSDTSLSAGELISGGTVSGTIVFEEPVDDQNLILIYQDSIWGIKSIQIKLQ